MKGSNELTLNEATMIEAVQYWLNALMFNAPTVKSVKPSTHGTYKADGMSYEFKIELDSEPNTI